MTHPRQRMLTTDISDIVTPQNIAIYPVMLSESVGQVSSLCWTPINWAYHLDTDNSDIDCQPVAVWPLCGVKATWLVWLSAHVHYSTWPTWLK